MFGFKKKNKDWGVVYDSVTKLPLDPVYVTAYDMLGKEIASSITDLDGRYGFILPPGMYKIKAGKTNYTFPSLRLNNKKEDEVYENLYFGEPILVTEREQVVAKNIPMDPLASDWNEEEKRRRGLRIKYRGVGFEKFVRFVFSLGFTVSFFAFVFSPSDFHMKIFASYAVVYFIRIIFLGKPRKNSRVLNRKTKTPVSFAIVRVFSAWDKREVTKKVTSFNGTFFCLVPNGNYFVTVETRDDKGGYSLSYTSNVFTVTKGSISRVFSI